MRRRQRTFETVTTGQLTMMLSSSWHAAWTTERFAAEGGDDGVHRIIAEPEGESAKAFSAVVEKIEDFVSQDQDSDGLEII